MASPYLLCLLSLLISTSLSAKAASAAAASTTITVPLSPLFSKLPSSDPWQMLRNAASGSLTRALHLKNPNKKSSSHPTKTSLFTRSFGGYSIFLSFGTPPQTLSFIMDTGSSLVWFPCTSRYVCSDCNFPNTDPKNISAFMPRLSSSSKIVGCKNPKCGYVFGPDVQSQCKDCEPNAQNCTQACPAYIIQYGLGNTAGILLLETLEFPNKIVPDFLVGCSIFSNRQPEGISGFGRGRESLPSQMGVTKFSYCSPSHRFDDTPFSTDLVLDTASDSGDAKTGGVSYTPFHTNPTAFPEFYYLTLRKIIVGDKGVKIPYSFLVPGSDGSGGTIVDSGTTFTFMERPVFEAVAKAFEEEMGNSTRALDVEKQSGMRPCFNVSGEKPASLPALVFQFKGGAKMELLLSDYFSFVGSSGAVCLTIVTDNVVGPGLSGGPAIIVGNYQQQNFYVEYDLKKERFGFRKQVCK